MDYYQAIILGIIQGITEWLPVSSKAVVALAGRYLFGMELQQALSTAIVLHLGTLIAAVAYFRKELIQEFTYLFQKGRKHDLLIFLAVSTVMTGLIGLPLFFFALSAEIPEWIFTVFIGIFLIFIATLHKNRKTTGETKELTVKNAMTVGVAQGIAGLPGMSRSGMTLAAFLGLNYSLEDAFRLSFLMSIPAVAGAEIAVYLLKADVPITAPMLTGIAAAAITGILTIKTLLAIAAGKDFYKITFALGAFILVLGIFLIGQA